MSALAASSGSSTRISRASRSTLIVGAAVIGSVACGTGTRTTTTGTPTFYDCKPFPANTWTHLVWNVERVGNQVHYISLTVGDQTYNVDTYFQNQPDWTLEEIDVAFQMDGNYAEQPYNVWLDEVNLTAD